MDFSTSFVFRPTSRDQENLTVVMPHVLERDPLTITETDTTTPLHVLPGDLLTQAAEVPRSDYLLCWLDGRKYLLLVRKSNLSPL